jgi:hypothetical protein
MGCSCLAKIHFIQKQAKVAASTVTFAPNRIFYIDQKLRDRLKNNQLSDLFLRSGFDDHKIHATGKVRGDLFRPFTQASDI